MDNMYFYSKPFDQKELLNLILQVQEGMKISPLQQHLLSSQETSPISPEQSNE